MVKRRNSTRSAWCGESRDAATPPDVEKSQLEEMATLRQEFDVIQRPLVPSGAAVTGLPPAELNGRMAELRRNVVHQASRLHPPELTKLFISRVLKLLTESLPGCNHVECVRPTGATGPRRSCTGGGRPGCGRNRPEMKCRFRELVGCGTWATAGALPSAIRTPCACFVVRSRSKRARQTDVRNETVDQRIKEMLRFSSSCFNEFDGKRVTGITLHLRNAAESIRRRTGFGLDVPTSHWRFL
jgi:hypothetical protein